MTAAKLISTLQEKNAFLCTAESCTGGLLVNELTHIPGSSQVIWGGLVTYDNSAKQELLGVSEQTLLTYGAVSLQVAEAMAYGCVKIMKKATTNHTLKRQTPPSLYIGISSTGIAGPEGGTTAQPVGLCFIGLYLISAQGVATQRVLEIRNPSNLDRLSQKQKFAEAGMRGLYDFLLT